MEESSNFEISARQATEALGDAVSKYLLKIRDGKYSDEMVNERRAAVIAYVDYRIAAQQLSPDINVVGIHCLGRFGLPLPYAEIIIDCAESEMVRRLATLLTPAVSKPSQSNETAGKTREAVQSTLPGVIVSD